MRPLLDPLASEMEKREKKHEKILLAFISIWRVHQITNKLNMSIHIITYSFTRTYTMIALLDYIVVLSTISQPTCSLVCFL